MQEVGRDELRPCRTGKPRMGTRTSFVPSGLLRSFRVFSLCKSSLKSRFCLACRNGRSFLLILLFSVCSSAHFHSCRCSYAQEKGAGHHNPLGSPCCRILAQPLRSLPYPMQISLLLPQSVEKRGDHKLGTPLRKTGIYTCIYLSLLFVRTVFTVHNE